VTLFSPSGLSNLELCPRKFAFDKVDKVPREGNAYAQFGTRVHSHLESYFKHGVMPPITEPEGNCAVALLAHLPPPQPGMKIEQERRYGRFHGYLDLTLGATVYDHKTTSDHKWAKTTDVLPHDLQAAIYAYLLMQETGELRVTLNWNYVTRHKPRVLPVVRTVTFADIQPTLDRACRLADEGQRILDDQIHALDLPPNPQACDAYGGCPHRTRCNLDAGTTLGSRMAYHQEITMTNASDFMIAMNAAHPPAPDPTAGWRRENGHRLNPTTQQWELDAAPAPVVVPINPPAPPPPAATAPPAPPPVPAAWQPPPPAPVAPGPPAAPAATIAVPSAEPVTDGEAYETIARGLELAASGFRMLAGSPSKAKKGRPPGSKNKPSSEM
jgi:hypothetical protein